LSKPGSSRLISAEALVGFLFVFLFPLMWGCLSGESDGFPVSEGLARVQDANGTRIKFDPLASPMPEIPFPNDIAAVMDPRSPTGRRLNIRMVAPTLLEQDVRNNINGLDGFGTFSPITVAFEEPLDLRTANAANIRLINIDPASPRYGEEVPMDFPPHDLPFSPADHPDWTAYPLIIEGTENSEQHPGAGLMDFGYFHFDPHWHVNNLMMEGNEEDRNCNGRLDPGEDVDFDGVLDHPNIAYADCYNPSCFAPSEGGGWVSPHPEVCPRPDEAPFNAWEENAPETVLDDKLVTNFEYQTNTLILRPLVALDERTTYAVALSRNVRDIHGNPVRSPFPYINHAAQTKQLAVLRDILPSLPQNPMTMRDVAFSWCFTTQTITDTMEVIRDGLKGRGPMAYLADRFPAKLDAVLDHGVCELGDCAGEGRLENTYIIRPAAMEQLFSIVMTAMTFSWIQMSDLIPMIQTLISTNLNYVDYFVVGWFTVPNFLEDADSHFDMDLNSGRARVRGEQVPFWLTVPKSRKDLEPPVASWYPDPPFPVAFYGHGYSGAKFEALGFACHLARFGLATFAIDETGHGPSGELEDLVNVLDEVAEIDGRQVGLDEILDMLGPLKGLVLHMLADLVDTYDPSIDEPKDLYDYCTREWRNEDPDATTCREPGSCPAKCMVVQFSETPLYRGAFLSGRAVDQTGDGVRDSGVDFWTARSFHTRDIVRQAAVDYMQAIRLLRSFDGERRWDFDLNGDGVAERAGDFNGDGIVDLGGACVPDYSACDPEDPTCVPDLTRCTDPDDPDDPNRQNYSGMGQSMGAFIVSLLQAIEPAMTAIAPISGGAGLMDIGMRTSNEGVREAVYLEVMGPMIIGGTKQDVCKRWTYYDVCQEKGGAFEGIEDGDWMLAFDALDGNLEKIWPIGKMPSSLKMGDRVVVRNLVNGEDAVRQVASFGKDQGRDMLGFRVNIPADVGDQLLVEIADGETGAPIWQTVVASIGKGYGYQRNSPDLRRMMGLSQMILDPADPANWAPHYFHDPLPGMKPKAALINHTLGDMKVPVGTGLTLARAARILDYAHAEDAYAGDSENEMMVKHWLPEAIPRIHRFAEQGLGDYFDPDNLGANDSGNGERDYDDDCFRDKYPRPTYPGNECEDHVLNEPHLMDDPAYEQAGVGASYDTKYFRKTFSTPGVESRNEGQGQMSGMRLPNIMVYDFAMVTEDRHGIFLSAPTKPFNLDQYMIYLIGRYFQTRGADLLGAKQSDNAGCLENQMDEGGDPVNPCSFWEGMR